MPIKGIRRFIECAREGDGTIGERLKILEAQRESVKNQISELERHLKMIDYKVWYYKTAQSLGSTAFTESYPAEKIPDEFKEFVHPATLADNAENV